MSTAYRGGRRDIKLLLFPKIPDLVPTGQLAEGAAKNLLPPGEGMPSSKSKGGCYLQERGGSGSILQERGEGAITGRKIPFPT